MPVVRVTPPYHDRARSLGELATQWIEHFVVHGPGDVQGQPVELDDELYALNLDCYALDSKGRRHCDSVFFSRAKGRDKSGHAARLVLFEAFGPARFAGFAKGGEEYRWRDFRYSYSPGEPMGQPVTYPFIRCLATEENQAGNTYDNVYFNLTEGPLGEGLSSNAAGLTRVNVPGGGEIVPSTASNASKDGGKESFVVFDETHLYKTAELRRMYDTVRRNARKRKAAEPWTLETSTMYLMGEESVAELSHDLAKDVLEGKVRKQRFLFDHREGFPDVDLADEESLLRSLKESYGPFADVMDLDNIVRHIWDPRNHPQDSKRFFLNMASAAADAWLGEGEWTRLVADKTVAPGSGVRRRRVV